MYLILRCRPCETLALVTKLKHDRHMLGLHEQDIVCPTYIVSRRFGRERRREQITLPILESFIFVKWAGNPGWAHRLESMYVGLHAMRDTEGDYAECSQSDIEQITPSAYTRPFAPGALLVVTQGPFRGVKGTLQSFDKNHDARLAVNEARGLNISTLQIPNDQLASLTIGA